MGSLFRAGVLAFIVLFAGSGWALTAQVLDEAGHPVAGAQVVIGANTLVTDAQGQFTAPVPWTTPQAVSVSAAGYVPVTYQAALPQQTVYRLSQTDGDDQIELAGTLSDYGTVRSDGKIDFAAVIPALKRDQLLHFDVGFMVSPQSDIIRILGREVALPSNLVLPRQTESYIFPITIEKPNFRMYVRRPGTYRFVASHGQFPLKRVVDEIRAGKSVFDVINYFTLLQSGVEDIDLKSNIGNRTIAVNRLPFNKSVTVTAPTLAADDIMLTVMLNELDGYLLPSDVKRFRTGETQEFKIPALNSQPQAVSLLVKQAPSMAVIERKPLTAQEMLQIPFDLFFNVIKTQGAAAVKANFNQISLAVHSDFTLAPKFLPLVDAPLVSAGRLSITPPTPVMGIAPIGMYVVYSQINTVGSGQMQTEQRSRLWEMWVPDWTGTVELPSNLAVLGQPNSKHRWEVLFLGQELPAGKTSNTGDMITHVTRNAVDL